MAAVDGARPDRRKPAARLGAVAAARYLVRADVLRITAAADEAAKGAGKADFFPLVVS